MARSTTPSLGSDITLRQVAFGGVERLLVEIGGIVVGNACGTSKQIGEFLAEATVDGKANVLISLAGALVERELQGQGQGGLAGVAGGSRQCSCTRG